MILKRKRRNPRFGLNSLSNVVIWNLMMVENSMKCTTKFYIVFF
jgi:hypothetical protein